jgi:hypothetical protein
MQFSKTNGRGRTASAFFVIGFQMERSIEMFEEGRAKTEMFAFLSIF